MSDREEFKNRIMVSFQNPFDGDEFASKYIDKQTQKRKTTVKSNNMLAGAFEAEALLHQQEEDGLIK